MSVSHKSVLGESVGETAVEPVTSLCCRFCDCPLKHVVADLGMSPLSNAYVTSEDLHRMEPFFPLCAYICGECLLVQVPAYEMPETIFTDYAYFTSYSDTALMHAQSYVEQMVERIGFDATSQVVEIASNDGYLLRYFNDKGIPVLGVEPAGNVAEVAIASGIPTAVTFFGTQTARELAAAGKEADLLVANNVIAHVPNLNDFVQGMKILTKRQGIITAEFSHVLTMMEGNQFDSIYQEHFSYFSLTTIQKVFAKHGLTLFDVQELPTHGGSLRIYARHEENGALPVSERLTTLLAREAAAGLTRLDAYLTFADKVVAAKTNVWCFLLDAKRERKSLVGYGAPAKANTLLNYCGIGPDFIEYTVDRNPIKQGRFLPGSRIPIHHPDKIKETKPDFVLIMPWNLKDEIIEQMAHIRQWGGRFVTLIPDVQVHA